MMGFRILCFVFGILYFWAKYVYELFSFCSKNKRCSESVNALRTLCSLLIGVSGPRANRFRKHTQTILYYLTYNFNRHVPWNAPSSMCD